MSDLESIGFSSSFGPNVSFDREICGNLTEDYKKVLILILIYKLLHLHKGSHPLPKRMFFYTLCKRPLTPPPRFYTIMLRIFRHKY